jgi:small subunit ribosomal protein S16
MVVIRLTRGGSNKKPFYHIVATDSRMKRDGRFIERLGYFDPIARKDTEYLRIASDRINYWKSHGAQLSQRVKQLVKENAKNTNSTEELAQEKTG